MLNSMILGVTFIDWLTSWYHIAAIVAIVIGLSLYIISRRLTIVIKKRGDITNKDKLLLTFRIIALIIFLAGIVLFCLPPEGFQF